jgi:hypothetical protein
MRRAYLITILALLALVPAAPAQSIFSTRGLGVPAAPTDARAHALGGIGIGLFGQNPSLVNPAEAVGYPFRGVVATAQTSSRELTFGAQSGQTGSNRFPLLRVLYPLKPGLVASAGYGAFLDQSWAIQTAGREVLGADTVTIKDVVSADGGLAQMRVGLAYVVHPAVAVGVDAGLYTGRLVRATNRTFADSSMTQIGAFQHRAEWTQHAPLLSAGVRLDPLSVLRLAASVTWGGTLELKGTNDQAKSGSVKLPLQYAAGASALLAPGLTAAVSTRHASWSRAADGFEAANAPADTWEYGAGIEWLGSTLGGARVPLRFGYHHAQLPFRFEGVTPSERTATLGFGLQLARTDFGPLATIDATVDRGKRSAPGTSLAENFWRFTVSMGVFGR